MKRALALALGLSVVFCLAFSTIASADTSGSRTKKVFATVDPNVGFGEPSEAGSGSTTPDPLGDPSSIVDLGSVQTGEIVGLVSFYVTANMEQIGLYATATPLFKGDDPNNTDVAPIPLNEIFGVKIAPRSGNPLNSGSKIAAFTGDTTLAGNWPARVSETIGFESSQNNQFCQWVDVTVKWSQDDPQKPTGQYSGKVRLTAVVL